MPVIRTGYLTARGAEPAAWTKTDTRKRTWWNKDPEFANGQYQMTMTWHHNIPDNLWRAFWNYMLVNNWTKEMEEFLYITGMNDRPGSDVRISTYINKFEYLHKTLTNLNASTGVNDSMADVFQRDLNTFQGAWALSDPSKLLTAAEMEALKTAVSWQDWNIVEGPLNTLRPADPGEVFDDFSGLIPKERGKLIKAFHGYVQAQIAAANVQSKGLLQNLQSCRGLRNMRVIPFSMEIWEKNRDSKGKVPKIAINSIERETWRLRSI